MEILEFRVLESFDYFKSSDMITKFLLVLIPSFLIHSCRSARSESSLGSPAVSSRKLLLDFQGLYTRRPESAEHLTRTLAFTRSPPLEKYTGTAEFSEHLKAAIGSLEFI